MGMLDWFKRAAGGAAHENQNAATPSALPEDDRGAEVSGLNFMSAIDAHMKWKTRLENYIQGLSQEDLKVEVVCRDDQCPLGKWIYSPAGSQYSVIDTFGEMKAQHAHFHACAGKVLSSAQAGHKEDALRMLQHGDYVRASERVKMLLAKLYVQISETRR